MRIAGLLALGGALVLAGTGLAGAASGTIVTTAELRAGPGPRYDVIGRVPAGTPVETGPCSGGWCRTQYGYVNAARIAPAGSPSGLPSPAASSSVLAPADGAIRNMHPGQTETMSGTRTTIGSANVRSGPGTEFEIVKTLPDATSVSVQNCANAWCRVDGGYVSLYVLSRGQARLVLPPEAQPRLPDPTTQPSLIPETAPIAGAALPSASRAYASGAPAAASNATTTANANVRAGPGAGYERLGTLPAGFPVTVESCADGWCRTQYGYVSARLVGRAPALRGRQGAGRPPATERTPVLGYWGERPSYWGGRPSYWRPHPAYPLPARS
ncbi:SH3 domain-containing protein [Ancylobacter oerskovii]|uniref:SH3 domain-containing protein n=1 Tax=Ancylobacter oerskovii TaxID=459519 RepID=A0ABW4Z0I6_9HYPH|nr:SH3 domain-containing protein [Ancylobacter oerskovii]MBS7542716.1 SH3 domain-containing protein [Ancylobacter oerskovii]